MIMSPVRVILLLVSMTLPVFAEVSQAQKELQSIISRQQLLFAKASLNEGKGMDPDDLKVRVQELGYDYEAYVKKYPDVAAGFAAYATLFDKIDMRKQATAMYLRANKLDPNLAYVKNQLGNHLAEDGKPLDAANYFLAAIKLEPKEPLYHYQLGTILNESRDAFLASGRWTRETLDKAMLEAFQRAAELAPNRIEFTYRHAEAFYDLEKPDWGRALELWGALEEKVAPGVERQTIRLHCANILIKQNRMDHARALLGTVDAEALAGQKEKLIAQLPENTKK